MKIRDELHKLNGWLRAREKVRLEVNSASTHERRRLNEKRRKAYERKLRWIERHRDEYNQRMRAVMRRRRDEAEVLARREREEGKAAK